MAFYRFENKADTEDRELFIDGAIEDEAWWEDDVTPEKFRSELNAGKGNITVWINSVGGDCFAASQIYTMLQQYRGKVTVKIDGLAASAASVIAMAGDTVMMSPTAMMMIHNPMTVAFGNKADMEQAIAVLEEVKESIMNAYQKKTGLQRAHIARLMDEETWMNANKAVELGFADGILDKIERTTNATAYTFSAAANMERIVASAEAIVKRRKAQEGTTEAPKEARATEATGEAPVATSEATHIEETKPEPKAQGRSIDQLLAELKTRNKY